VSALQTSVHVPGGAKPFGALTHAEVVARAAELEAAVGFGPTARVAAVARAWAELGRRMQGAGAATVGELDEGTVTELAEPLWIVAPGGSLLRG
jgi:hypothetical protein